MADDLRERLRKQWEVANARLPPSQRHNTANILYGSAPGSDYLTDDTEYIPATVVRDLVDSFSGTIEEINELETPLNPEDTERLAVATAGLQEIQEYIENNEEAEWYIPGLDLGRDPEAIKQATETALENGLDTANEAFEQTGTTAEQAGAIADSGARRDEVIGSDDTELQFKMVHGASQCYLLYNISAFAQSHREMLLKPAAGDVAGGEPAYGGIVDGVIQTGGYFSNAINDTRMFLIDEGMNSSEIASRMSIKKDSDKLLNVTPQELGHFVPMLKIYKIYKNGSQSTSMVEFKFNKGQDLDGIANAITVHHPNNSQTQFSKGTSGGIKSFDWTFLGTDPFTATRDISATLKLVFQDFSSLVKVHVGRDLYDESGAEITYKYLDLIVQPDCRQEGSDIYGQVFVPECYEVRVDVGYQDIDSPTVRNDIKSAVKYQKQSLYLIPNEHDIEFADDGHVEVTIKFRGRLESLMGDRAFNVLMPLGGFASSAQLANTGLPFTGALLDIEKRIKDLREEEELTEGQKTELRNAEASRSKYMSMASQIVMSGIMGRLQNANMVYSYTIPAADWRSFLSWQEDSPGGLNLPERLDKNNLNTTVSEASLKDLIGLQGGSGDRLKEVIEEQQEKFAKSVESGEYIVNYFFLGDLLATVVDSVLGEVIFQAAGELDYIRWQGWMASWNETIVDERFTLTDLQAKDITDQEALMGYLEQDGALRPEGLKEAQQNLKILLGNINVEYTHGEASKEETINLAHVPISVPSFYKFLVDNILAPEKEYYSLFSFIDDLLSDVVVKLLSEDCFGGFLDAKARAVTTTKVVNKPFEDKYFKPDSKNPINGYMTVHLQDSSMSDPFFFQEVVSEAPVQNTPITYFAINAAAKRPSDMNGNRALDISKGMPHVQFGSRHGVLKSVSFNKTDQEFVPEARYESEGAYVFNQLSNVYDANFSMVGNSIFSPGQYIYLDSYSLGAGHPYHYKALSEGKKERSWANIMGLGGYHIITEVANSISPGEYNTNLKARFEYGGRLTGDDEADAATAAGGDE